MFFFTRQWIKHPLKVGSAVPSSHFLAKKMVGALNLPALANEKADRKKVCLEFGPGTGVFTRELLRGLPADCDLILLEKNPHFASHLRKKFPSVQVLSEDVLKTRDVLQRLEVREVDCILSGLPLRSMPQETVLAFSEIVSDILKPSGVLVQFTYFPFSPIPVRNVSTGCGGELNGEKIGFVPLNFPPAFVWRYQKNF